MHSLKSLIKEIIYQSKIRNYFLIHQQIIKQNQQNQEIYVFFKKNIIPNHMRPVSAITRINQNTTTRSIWKKYQSIKPEKNQFYCFKTITEILQGNHHKIFKESKSNTYYKIVSSPKKYAKQVGSKQIIKQSKKKMSVAGFQRNPNIKKTLTNNFFSSKQIGKENHISQNFNKIKTQMELKSFEDKFLPYRQQTLSIVKQSKILNQGNEAESGQLNQCYEKKAGSKKTNDRNSKNYLARIEQAKNMSKRMNLRTKQKTRHILQHTKVQKTEANHYHSKTQKQECFEQSKNPKNRNKENQQFIIGEWQNQNLNEDALTFSGLLAGKKFQKK